MTRDDYLRNILTGNSLSPVAVTAAANHLLPTIRRWANNYLLSVQPSGSFAKGTAVLSGTDIDLFISLAPETAETYEQIHQTLMSALKEDGFTGKPQNVSIGVKVGHFDVDLVPGRRLDMRSNDHHIYRRKSESWTKTNIEKQIKEVTTSGRIEEIRLMKIWRNRRGLDFPSCYLELATITFLNGKRYGELADNLVTAFEALATKLSSTRITDPGNPSNVISNELTQAEKQIIERAARAALSSRLDVLFG